MHALSMRVERISGSRVLEVGVGSGVILATMAELGAAHLAGVDVEAVAIQRTSALLAGLPGHFACNVVQGNMWDPFAGQQFDLIVANLPQFPSEHLSQPTRLESWSNGGSNGRLLLDQFLAELRDHLVPGGSALLVHSAFSDLELSRARLHEQGLIMHPMLTTLIQVEPGKLEAMSFTARTRFNGNGLKQVGSYVFSLTHVVEVIHAAGPSSAAA